MAEWLRRETWNLMGYALAGSNPAGCDIFYIFPNASPYNFNLFSSDTIVVKLKMINIQYTDIFIRRRHLNVINFTWIS